MPLLPTLTQISVCILVRGYAFAACTSSNGDQRVDQTASIVQGTHDGLL